MCFDSVLCVCVTGIYMERDASCCHNKLVLKTSQNFSNCFALKSSKSVAYCRIRPTLLLVHGSAASLTQYLPLAAALNETPGSTSFHFLFTSFHFLCQSHGGF